MLHGDVASQLIVLTAIDGVRCDRSDESLGLAIQEEWWRAIDLLSPPTEGLNNGTRNESLHSVAVDTKNAILDAR